MTLETQPYDSSEKEPLTPREVLRSIVLNLSKRTIGSDEETSFTVQCGELRLPGSRFLVTEIISPSDHLPRDIRQLLPARLLKLSVYDAREQGSVSSITMSDDSDKTVIGEIDGKEWDGMTPFEEENFITSFFAHNRITKLGKMLSNGGEKFEQHD